jgi:hypothetical protein
MTNTSQAQPRKADSGTADAGTADVGTADTGNGTADKESLLPDQDAPLGGFGHATSIEPGAEDAQRSAGQR